MDSKKEYNRCRHCKHYHQFTAFSLTGICDKTNKEVYENQVVECYRCNYFELRKELSR